MRLLSLWKGIVPVRERRGHVIARFPPAVYDSGIRSPGRFVLFLIMLVSGLQALERFRGGFKERPGPRFQVTDRIWAGDAI